MSRITVRRKDVMNQITAHLPDGLAEELNAAAARLKSSRSEIVRQAIELYLEEIEDLEAAAERLRDPNDPSLDWDRVKRALRDTDQVRRAQGVGTYPATGPEAHRGRHRAAC